MRIAIADDDITFVEFIKSVTVDQGHSCATFSDGQALVTQLQRDTFDLVILDLHMPRLTGQEVLRWIRANMPAPPAVIMLTSQTDKGDIARTLNAGADDYIVKPESAPIIAARIEAVLRRTTSKSSPAQFLTFGHYRFDRLDSSVIYAGEAVRLTAKEFALALVFFENVNRALSRSYLLGRVWHSVAGLPTRTLDVHVSHIRAKLALSAERGFRLHTIVNYGYRLETSSESE